MLWCHAPRAKCDKCLKIYLSLVHPIQVSQSWNKFWDYVLMAVDNSLNYFMSRRLAIVYHEVVKRREEY